jgi:hypothetical protein
VHRYLALADQDARRQTQAHTQGRQHERRRPLGACARPDAHDKPRIKPFEATIYRVTAILKYARHVDDPADANGKGGGDLDYHLVIADINHPAKTMIVEFPDPGCTKGATTTRRNQMKAARLAFATDCHGAPHHDFANLSGRATITGVGFYDEPHAKGRSLHGVELHPVLSFSSTNCRWVHSERLADPQTTAGGTSWSVKRAANKRTSARSWE